ncbi:MAG: DUF5668 domain-containing protein [Candidatus Edwardsbacteria bacterium]|jgi:hypothetical protein|nr:DUF5668 domain-containing protein [Candidatus Edwardsbacteria bacterium]
MFCCHRTAHKVLWGLFWVALGTWILLSNHGLLAYGFSFHRDWPIVLIAVGVVILVRSVTRRRRIVEIHRGCCDGGETPDQPARAEILKAVEDGTMTAAEAAAKLQGR